MNKVKRINFQIFILIFFSLSFQANPQAFSDASYFPLHIGNQWTLQSSISNDLQIETIIDTLRFDGNLYFSFDQFRDNSQVFMRMFENKVFRYMDTSEVLWFDFSADTGDSWTVPIPFAGEWTVYLLSKTDTIDTPVGIFTDCYHFWFSGITDYEWEEWFAPSIGIVERKLHGFAFFNWYLSDVIIVSINAPRNKLDKSFYLHQNYPNPFNPKTIINYSIPHADFVLLKVYDLLGSEIATLVSEDKTAGNHLIEFDASEWPSGIYFYRMTSCSYSITKKMSYTK